jgi:hypothetical protein
MIAAITMPVATMAIPVARTTVPVAGTAVPVIAAPIRAAGIRDIGIAVIAATIIIAIIGAGVAAGEACQEQEACQQAPRECQTHLSSPSNQVLFRHVCQAAPGASGWIRGAK